MNSSPGQIITTVRTSMDTSDFSTYQIIGFVIIFLIVASIVYYTRDFLYLEWKKLYPINELTGEYGDIVAPNEISNKNNENTKSSTSTTLDYSKMATSPKLNDSLGEKESSTLASSEQTWCLVGEDMAGRWCVQVQTPKHCDTVRSYKTKNQCEKSDK